MITASTKATLTFFNIEFKLIVKSAPDASQFEQLPVANNVPSLSLKLIGKSILEGELFAPTTPQALKLIVVLASIADFQLVIEYYLIKYSE